MDIYNNNKKSKVSISYTKNNNNAILLNLFIIFPKIITMYFNNIAQ